MRETLRFSALTEWKGQTVKLTAVKERILMLWDVQQGVCGLCHEDMPHPTRINGNPRFEPTLDHVWPRNPQPNAIAMAVCRGVKALRGTVGNSLAAHHICNTRKGNRLPTGCEQITLMVVNLKTGERSRPW